MAVNHLLQYLHHMLSSLAVHSPAVAAVVAAFPSSLYLMRKVFGIGTNMSFLQNVSLCISIMNDSNILFLEKFQRHVLMYHFLIIPMHLAEGTVVINLLKKLLQRKERSILHSKHIAICHLSIV